MPGFFRVFCLAVLLLGTPLRAEDRLALVIGNSAYGTVSALDNPSNDARLIAGTLTGLGFEVTALIDATQIEMKRGIAQFGRDLRKAGTDATGLFYYAGHGVQSFGTNYLLPVDVSLSDAADLDLVAIEAQSVLRQMFSARNRTNIMILDACRNNPFRDIPEFNDNGLAEMQAPTGTFLAYATAPGGVALDGLDGNSPFTSALADLMPTPGLPVEQMFKQVRVAVLEQTGGAQTPWDASSLTSDFVFAAAQQETVPASDIEELQVWRAVQASADPVQLMLFLRGYPNGRYADEARRLLAVVMENELAAGGAETTAPAPRLGPSDAEKAMFEAAQDDGSIAGYDAYLQAFPDGTFAEFARQEIAALQSDTATDPLASADQPLAEPAEPEEPQSKQPEAGPVTFASPLISDHAAVSGKSMEQLIGSTPLFAPIDGLPEEYWKDKTCSSCHQWNRDTLCKQANAYLNLNMQRSLEKQHPFGGAMKRSMKSWAAGGCQ
ncbi:caspase family protein [Seohaeicola saemankumensis]|nr:caspase family protein [Seohaeicola saemankumensis]MCA0872562.1 caspase family protein [Seohaeicola saemankumensis]